MPVRFLRLTFSILDRDARVRFILFAIGAVVIAGLEAGGVFLFVPLTTLIVAGGDKDVPAVATQVSKLFGTETALGTAGVLAVLVLVAFTVKGVAALLLLRWSISNALQQEARLAGRLFSGYLRAPYFFHLEHHSGELQRTLNESLILVFRRTVPFVLAGAADALSIVSVALVIAISDPSVAVVALAYFALVGIVYQRLIGGRQKVAAKASHTEIAERYRHVQDALRGAKEIAVLHRQDEFVRRFLDTKLELVGAQRLLVFFQIAPRHFLDLAFLAGGAVIASLAFATREPPAALASVGLFLGASFRLIPPLNRVLGAMTLSRTAEPGVEQVIHDLATVERAASIAPGHGDGDALGSVPIELRGVQYHYRSREERVLRDISMRIGPGEDVGLVGSSGAGKTTLLDVMLGLLDPTAGEVLLAGVPLADCRSAWQRSIGYVPQDVMLIDRSVRENVAFGISPGSTDDRDVWRALGQAQLDDFVRRLPAQLDTPVGEAGVALSGGQRQRIGLARALYHHPAVLVLDEATSALDSETERRVIDTIMSLRRSLTIVSVAHRLSTLTHCDRIYFLQNGTVRAVGTLAELQASVPDFAELIAMSRVGGTDGDHT